MISNVRGSLKNKQIEVLYDFNTTVVYRKILSLFVIILMLLSLGIMAKRINLEAFADKAHSEWDSSW